ncbi:AIR synthase-related protein [Treponema sp. OMZ 788]|uniref:AIR synthase-related protein n=1 Tax=Treponema sp. OMZ 788 TaxID=2563664 RepID=UPI0020A4AE9F|nr:AIR synthase-related protein [Treponema sp. OMZ 788]
MPFLPLKKEAAELYKKLHSSIMRGLVLSCHDLSEGGLAAALYEMCLSGIGAELSSDFHIKLGASKIASLFGETTGCLLVEIAEENRSAFEKEMAGSAIYEIGKTCGKAGLKL